MVYHPFHSTDASTYQLETTSGLLIKLSINIVNFTLILIEDSEMTPL